MIFYHSIPRYFCLFTQVISTLLLLNALKGNFIVLEIALTLILLSHTSFRLPIKLGSILNSILLCIIFIWLRVSTSYIKDLLVLCIEGLFAGICEVSIYYREQLVDNSQLVHSQERSLENLSAANQSFVGYLENVEADSAERERFRITRELHDSIGYSMTNISMMMNASKHLIGENPEKLLEYCSKTKEVASSTLRETRDILYKLRDINKQSPKNVAIFFGRLCHDFTEATSVITECNTGNLPPVINEVAFNVLFRAVQVGFINAIRHGNTTHIKLYFWLDDNQLTMMIWNNMQHMNIDTMTVKNEGIGLKGIKERLETINGTLSLQAVMDAFKLTVIIPKEELSIETDSSVNSR
jgi:signal transduction histidine kinase